MLCIPEAVSGLIAGVADEGAFVYSLGSQGIAGKLHQLCADTPAAEIRVDAGVIDKSAPPVMTAENTAYDLSVFLGGKSGVWISPQELLNSAAAVVKTAKPHSLNAAPEGENLVIVVESQQSVFH